MADELILLPEEEKSLSAKEMLGIAKEYWQEIKANKRLIGYIAGGLTALLLIMALLTKPTYTATLTFLVDDGTDGTGSSVSTILAAVGLAKPAATNMDKIVGLAKSRQIIGEALFEKDTVNGQFDYFANHFIREYEFQKKWKSRGMGNFLFKTGDPAKFNRQENSAMLAIYNMLVGTVDQVGLFVPAYSSASAILNLKLTTTNERLSLDFTNILFEKLSAYYILKTIEKEQLTFKLVKEQTDSIHRAMKHKVYGAAKFTDQNTGLLFSYNQVPGYQMQAEGEIMADLYGRALGNLSIADYQLKDNRPYVAAIDYPIAPLPALKPSLLLQLILGLIGGALLGTMFVAGRKKYREFLKTLE